MYHNSENLEYAKSYKLLLLIFSESGCSLYYCFFFHVRNLSTSCLQTNNKNGDIMRINSQSFLFSSCLNNLGLGFICILYLGTSMNSYQIFSGYIKTVGWISRLVCRYCDSLFLFMKIIHINKIEMIVISNVFQSLGYRVEKNI